MLDLVLYILLGLVVITLGVWGGIVSAKSLPLGENKPLHFWVFVGCGIVSFILTVFVGFRSYYAQKDAAKQQAGLSQTLKDTLDKLTIASDTLQQSRMDEVFMKGQLDGLGIAVGRLGTNGGGNNTDIARALRQIGGDFHTSGIQPPAIQQLSNEQLRAKVQAFSKEMEKFAFDYSQQQSEFFQMRAHLMNPSAMTEEQKKQMGDASWALAQGHLVVFEHNFRDTYLPSATEYRNELERRTVETKPLDTRDQERLVWGTSMLAGQITPETVKFTAEYLNSLATQLGR
jgi:hypothetical protein